MGIKVRKYGKGNSYFFDISYKGERIKKAAGNDLETAQDAALILERKLKSGEITVSNLRSTTASCRKNLSFKELGEKWLALPHEWRESTAESYKSNLTLHIYPVFGKIAVDEITRPMVRRFIDQKLTAGCSPAFVSLIKAAINGTLDLAVEYGFIGANPAKTISVKKSKTPTKHITALTEDEAERLLEASKTFVDGWYRPVLLFALRTGARLGELQALQWEDVDLVNRVVTIRRSWRKGRTTLPKNGRERRVDMTPLLAETLKARQITQKRYALKNGRPLSTLVFANRRGNMLDRGSFGNALAKCLKAAGLKPIRVHDLRHSYATIRIMRGHNIADVSAQLGHSSINITMSVYCHWVPGKFKSQVDELDGPAPKNVPNSSTIQAGTD